MEEFDKFERNELLIEQQDVRQHEGEPFRRIFFSKKVQIDIWYENNQSALISGTQITLDENHVITAIYGKPISYTYSETDDNPLVNQASIMRENGYADKNQIDEILKPIIIQLPKIEFEYVGKIVEEIDKDKYINYPII